MVSKLFFVFLMFSWLPSTFLNNFPSISLRAMSLSNSHVSILKECLSDDDCNNGICHLVYDYVALKIKSSECVCYSPYMSYKGVCDYKQKDKHTALLLSIFLGTFGIDWLEFWFLFKIIFKI